MRTNEAVNLPQMSEIAGVPENTTENTHAVVAELFAVEHDCRRLLDIPCGAALPFAMRKT